jgi:hypothetical protein
MRITIIVSDNMFGVDEVFRRIDLSKIDQNIHAVQFDSVKGGEVEYIDERNNEKIDNFDSYQEFYDAWEDAAPILLPESAPTYQELRAAEYPPIGDQLDALYHAGVFPAAMTASIKAIKDKYPK